MVDQHPYCIDSKNPRIHNWNPMVSHNFTIFHPWNPFKSHVFPHFHPLILGAPPRATGAYYGPHEARTGYPIKTKNGNAMAYDASVGKALWEASEKAHGGTRRDVRGERVSVWCMETNMETYPICSMYGIYIYYNKPTFGCFFKVFFWQMLVNISYTEHMGMETGEGSKR